NMSLPSDITDEASGQLTSPVQLASLLSHENLLDNRCRRNAFGAQLLYIACFSPRLTVLDLPQTQLLGKDHLFSRHSPISVSVDQDNVPYSDIEQVLTAVVKNCPSLVESLTLRIDTVETCRDMKGTVAAVVIGSKLIDADIFISLPNYLPKLTIMDAPTPNSSEEPHQPNQIINVASNIVAHCLKMKNLRKPHVTLDAQGKMALAIVNYMPPSTLESFQSFRCYRDDHPHARSDPPAQGAYSIAQMHHHG
ncbi:hypothetical protein BGX30_006913, partial [Mortierella sp. GBA39]